MIHFSNINYGNESDALHVSTQLVVNKDGSRIANFTTINKDRLREALISYQTDEKKYFVAQLMKSYQK